MPDTRRALITGITGQDGSYLAELLLKEGWEVHGIIRRASLFNTSRIDHLYDDPHARGVKLFLHYGDLEDSNSLHRILEKVDPDHIYNLGAQSHVKVSFDQPVYTADVGAIGTLRLLETLREFASGSKKDIRFYQACSSEMFGATPPPQNEKTVFYPRSPYAVGKVASYYFTVNYREAYNLFAVNGILFNHESPRRGGTFVTRKITRAAGRIKLGLQEMLYLGNLEARRDWGFAGDYVRAMFLMMQHSQPDDFVIATGESHSVREFVEAVFKRLDLDFDRYVAVDPRYFRPTEVDHLLGDAAKAREALGWKPEVSFDQLVDMMVEHDLELAKKEAILKERGYEMNLGESQGGTGR